MAVKETTTLSRAALDDECDSLWVSRFADCPFKSVVELFCVGDLTRVIVSGDWFLYYLLIEDGSQPTIVDVMRLPANFSVLRLSLGLDYAVIVDSRTKACHLTTYALADGGDESIGFPFSVSKTPLSVLPAVFPHPIMDEDTGRIVILSTFAKPETVVIDFSLVERNRVDPSTVAAL